MKKKLKKAMTGALAVLTCTSVSNCNVLFTSAADFVVELMAEISSGDVNGDGVTDSADVEAISDLLGSTSGSISSSGFSSYDVYRDGVIDVRDLMAAKQLAEGKSPEKPETESSGNSVNLEISDAECCPGEQVSVDVNIVDWNQDINAVELYIDFDSNLSLESVACMGDYQYVVNENVLKIYGFNAMADVYRGTVATLIFNVPDTAYGDYDVKVTNCAIYNDSFQTFSPTTDVGLITADVTERPLYLAPSYVNSGSLRLSWSMPYCSGSLEGYIVYRDGVEIARTTEPWYYDEDLVNGQKYTYSVQAYGSDNYLSAKSKTLTAMPQDPEISAVMFPDNASVIGGKSTYVKCSLEKTVDAAEYSLSYIDLQGEKQTIFSGGKLAFSTVDIKWNIGEIPSGDYELIFSVTDRDGATAEKNVNVTVDTTPPEQVFGFEVFEAEEKMQLTWGIAAEAKVVGYNIYRRTESSNYTLLTYVDGRDVLEYTDENLEEGDVYFYVMCAVDKFGQEGIYSEEKSAAAKGDETPPELTLFLPKNGNVLNHFVTITLKAEDNIGVASITAFVSEDDGESWEELFTGKGSSVSYSLDTTVYTAESIKVKAVAYDYAGNESNDLVHIYAIDNTGPEKVEEVNSVAVTSVTATISWNDVPDDDFSYFTVKYGKTDDTTFETVNVYTTLGVNLNGLTPGTEYIVSVAAVDIYGNIGEYSEPFVFTTALDTNVPVIVSIKPAPGYYNEIIPLEIKTQDDFSTASVTILTSQSCEDDAEWANIAVIENAGTGAAFTASYDLDLASYDDGKIYVRAFAEDNSGNVGEMSAIYEYIVDKTAPAAPTAFSVSYDANAIQLQWEPYEDNIDSAAFSLYRSIKEDGEYVRILEKTNMLNYYDRNAEPQTEYFYKLTAIDAAGNESEMSDPISASLAEDTEAPEIISISPSDGNEVSTVNNKVSVLVSDNVKLSSVTMEYRISEDEEYKVFSKSESIDQYYTVAEGTLPAAALRGENVQIRISAVDSSGISSEIKEVTYCVNNSSTAVKEINIEQLDEYINVTWNAEENDSSLGYYIYKKVNAGDWTRIGAVEVNTENDGCYSFSDYDNGTAGTVIYKIESYSTTGIKNEKQSSAIQIYTNPTAELECEITQQKNVEYIYDASGCKDYYGITSVSIDYGDGTFDSADSASNAVFIHKYSEVGNYQVKLTCENEQGLVSVYEQTVEVIERTLIGESVITVNTEEGKPASGINVYIDLGTQFQKKYTTDSSGKITVKTSAGIHTIGVYGDGYLPAEKDCTILAGSGNKFDFTVIEENIVTADFTVERMTLDEIKAVGIDTTAAENQHIVEVSVDLSYALHDAPSSTLKYYVNSSGSVVGGSGGWSGSWGGGSGSGGGSGASTVTKPVYIDYDYETNEVNTVITLTVPVGASFLKEFFHAKLTIYNNADEQYTISDNQVELNLPDGLSLVNVSASADKNVSFDAINGGECKEIDWIIRGDAEGTYDLSASYHGILNKFNEEINAVFTTDEPIVVYGETAVSVDINVPENIYRNQFVFEVAMTNNSPVDVYCPSTNVGEITASIFGANNYPLPIIIQRRLMKDEKYIDIIDNETSFDTLEPGYTYSVIYSIPDIFAGASNADSDAYYKSRFDIINAAMTVLNNSKIPVSLNIVDMSEFVVVRSKEQLPEYDPETQFMVVVTDETNKKFVSRASVQLGDQTVYTNSSGYAIMDIPDEKLTLTVKHSRYEDVTIEEFDGYANGYYAVVLNKKTNTGSSGNVSTGEGSGSGGISQSGDDKWYGTLELTDSFSVSLSDDIPLIGGTELSIDGFDLPIQGEMDDEGHAALYIGNWEWYDKTKEWNHESRSWEKADDTDDGKSDFLKKFEETSEFLKDLKNDKNGCMDKYREQLGSKPFNASWNINVSFCGALWGTFPLAKGFEESIAENGIEFSGDLVLTISGGVTLEEQIFIEVVPVTLEIEISDEAKLSAGITIVQKGEEITSSGHLKLDNTLGITPFAGVGITGIVAAGVYGSMELELEATLLSSIKSEQGIDKVSASFEIGLQAYLGPFKLKKSFAGSELTIYDKEQGGYVWNWEAKNSVNPFSLADLFDESKYALADDIAQTVWRGEEQIISGDATGCLQLAALEENSSGNTSHQIAAAGNNIVMVYIEEDSDRAQVNRLKLMYSVYNDVTQTWSAPKQVDSNNTGDYAPVLYSDGENIWLIYQDTSDILDNNAEISEWTAAQNIAAAKFNSDTLEFSEPVLITNDADSYDSSPVIAIAGEKTLAVWISNKNCDYFGTNNTNSIVYSELTEDGWSDAEVLLENLNAVTNLTAGEVNGELCTVFVTDMDNDLTTFDDRSLNVRKLSETQAYNIATGSIDSVMFAQAENDSNICLYWYQNGNIMKTNNLTFVSEVFDEPSATLSGDFVVDGNRILWCGTNDGKLSNLYESVYDSNSESWSSAVMLSDQSDYIENISAVKMGENTIAVMNQNNVSVSETDVDSVNSIVWTTFSGFENLTVTDVDLDTDSFSEDGNVTLDIYVVNNGETEINSLNVSISDSDGVVISQSKYDVVIPAGESSVFTAKFDPDLSKSLDFVVEVTSDDITDMIPDDNSASFNAEFSNLSVETIKTDDNTLAVTVFNSGTVYTDNAEINVVNYISNESITSFGIDSIAPGTSITKEIDLREFIGTASDDLKIIVSAGDSSGSAIVFDAMKDVGEGQQDSFILGDVNSDSIIDAVDASMVLAEYAANATNHPTIFTEDQRKAADVNYDRIIDAVDASKILAYYAAAATGKVPSFN